MRSSKLFTSLLTGLVLLVVGGMNVQAASSAANTGIQQRYVVTFDGEGEATVAAQFTQQNYGKDPLDSLTVTIPGKKVEVEWAIQQYPVTSQTQYCTHYGIQGTCDVYQPQTVTQTETALLEPTASSVSNGTQLTIPLKSALESNKSTTLYLTYKVEGYVTQKSLGLSSFAFETAKFDGPVSNVDVAVYVDPNLYLQGSRKAGVNYSSPPSLAEGIAQYAADTAGNVATVAGLESDFSRIADNAVSTATNLDAQESVTVRGAYATSWIRVNLLYLIGGVVGVLLFILVIVLGERAASKRASHASKHLH